jgi:hypothetical protein
VSSSIQGVVKDLLFLRDDLSRGDNSTPAEAKEVKAKRLALIPLQDIMVLAGLDSSIDDQATDWHSACEGKSNWMSR